MAPDRRAASSLTDYAQHNRRGLRGGDETQSAAAAPYSDSAETSALSDLTLQKNTGPGVDVQRKPFSELFPSGPVQSAKVNSTARRAPVEEDLSEPQTYWQFAYGVAVQPKVQELRILREAYEICAEDDPSSSEARDRLKAERHFVDVELKSLQDENERLRRIQSMKPRGLVESEVEKLKMENVNLTEANRNASERLALSESRLGAEGRSLKTNKDWNDRLFDALKELKKNDAKKAPNVEVFMRVVRTAQEELAESRAEAEEVREESEQLRCIVMELRAEQANLVQPSRGSRA